MFKFALLLTIYHQSILTGTIAETHRVVAQYETLEECQEVAYSYNFKDQMLHLTKITPNVLLIEGRCIHLDKPTSSVVPG